MTDDKIDAAAREIELDSRHEWSRLTGREIAVRIAAILCKHRESVAGGPSTSPRVGDAPAASPLTPYVLAELERLWEASTPGEWFATGVPIRYRIKGESMIANCIGQDVTVKDCEYTGDDAAFIAASHNAMPALLSELRSLRAAVAENDGEIERLKECCDMQAMLLKNTEKLAFPVWQSCEVCGPAALDETGKCPKCAQVYDFGRWKKYHEQLADRDKRLVRLREGLKRSHPLDGDAAERCLTWDEEDIARLEQGEAT